VKDQDRTKGELIKELEEPRRRISEPEESPESRQLPKEFYVSRDQTPLSEASEDDITETIDFTKLLTQDVTTSGSFDIRGDIWKTTFGKLLQALPMPALLIDASHCITFVNQACSQISPSYQGVEGRPFSDLFSSPSSAERARSLVESIFSTRKSRVAQGMLRIDNAAIWCQMAFRPIRIMDERFILVLADDLTREWTEIEKRKQTEKELRESERRYRDLVQNIDDLICTHDMQGNLLFVNQAPAKALGRSPEDMVGTNLRDYLAPEVRHLFEDYLTTIQTEGRASGLMLVRTRGGEKRIWEYRNTLQTEGLGAPFVSGLARDVTDRKRSEQALLESERRFREVLERVDLLAATIDENGTIIFCNDFLLNLTGWRRDEVLEVVAKPMFEINRLISRAK